MVRCHCLTNKTTGQYSRTNILKNKDIGFFVPDFNRNFFEPDFWRVYYGNTDQRKGGECECYMHCFV